MFKGLSFFKRTSSRRAFNVASFHAPNSLTWSWVLTVFREEVAVPRPYAGLRARGSDFPGFELGLGQLIGVVAYRLGSQWHWSASLFWFRLSFVQQPQTRAASAPAA